MSNRASAWVELVFPAMSFAKTEMSSFLVSWMPTFTRSVPNIWSPMNPSSCCPSSYICIRYGYPIELRFAPNSTMP